METLDLSSLPEGPSPDPPLFYQGLVKENLSLK